MNAAGEHKHHRLEPYGLFIRDGRWYVAGRDRDLGEIRLYAVARTASLEVNAARPKTPDFECPRDFDVRTFICLPFQYGPDSFEARISFEPAQAWRAPALTAGIGQTVAGADGSLTWSVSARDANRLMRWVVENGPGLRLVAPSALAEALRDRLEGVAAVHE